MTEALNLFPSRVPIGRTDPSGSVFISPEFSRALRVVQDRLGGGSSESVFLSSANMLSVLTYGAVGDGVRDDTAAIQDAINDAQRGGNLVWFPAGYTFSVGSLSITASCSLMIHGTVIQRPAVNLAMIRFVATHYGDTLRIAGTGILDGNYDNTHRSKTQNDGSFSAVVYQVNGKGFTYIDGLTIQNTVISAIYSVGGIWIQNCLFRNQATHTGTNPTYTIQCIPDNNITVSSRVPDTTFGNGYSPLALYQTGRPDQSAGAAPCVTVLNCRFIGKNLSENWLNPGGVFISEGNPVVTPVMFERVTVAHCVFTGMGQSWNGNLTGAVDTYDGCKQVILAYNHIELYSYAGLKIQRADNVIVIGNTIKDADVWDGGSYAIVIEPQAREGSYPYTAGPPDRRGENHYNNVVSGNIIENPLAFGIFVGGQYTSVSGNIIKNTRVGYSSNCNPIYINSDKVTVSQCDVVGYHGYGIFVGTNVDDLKIRDCYIDCLSSTDFLGGTGGIFFAGNNKNCSLLDNTVLLALSSGQTGVYFTDGEYLTIRGHRHYNGYAGFDIRDCLGASLVDVLATGYSNYDLLASGTTTFSGVFSSKKSNAYYTASPSVPLVPLDAGTHVADSTAAARVVVQLPPTSQITTGCRFQFINESANKMQVQPLVGTEVIGTATAGYSALLNNIGDCLTLRCVVAGRWEVEASVGGITYIP